MPFKKQKWRKKELMLLLERLHLYLKAGLPLDRACEIASDGLQEKKKADLQRLSMSIREGNSFARSLVESTGIGSSIYALILHGESSGRLSHSIDMSRLMLERSEELRNKCASALAYPVIIGIFALLLTVGLIRGVMPQIIPMLRGLHVELPLLTRIVMAVSDLLSSYGLYLAIAVPIALIVFKFSLSSSSAFKRMIHSGLSRLPLIGSLLGSASLSLFLRSCGSLIEAGLSVPESYARTLETVWFMPVHARLALELPKANKGVPLAALLSESGLPMHAVQLARAGEMTGTLGQSMVRAADIMDRDIDHSLKRLTALIEPVMMAGMGCLVGSIALSIMMPIYDVSKVLQR